MMRVGPLAGILGMILILILLLFASVLIFPPPPKGHLIPHAAMAYDEDSPDYTLKIIYISERVALSDVELVIKHECNNSAFMYDLESIIHLESEDKVDNITYHDIDKDNKLSAGDLLVLRTDYDGPKIDGNNDGNFTNEGPFGNKDQITLFHEKTGRTICRYTIYI